MVLVKCGYCLNCQGILVTQVAGRTGRVVDIDSDGDLKVAMNDGNTWVLNPQCCIKQKNDHTNVRRTGDEDDDDDNDIAAGKTGYIRLANVLLKKWVDKLFKH